MCRTNNKCDSRRVVRSQFREKSVVELQAELAGLIEKNEKLNEIMVRTMWNMVRLAEANVSLQAEQDRSRLWAVCEIDRAA